MLHNLILKSTFLLIWTVLVLPLLSFAEGSNSVPNAPISGGRATMTPSAVPIPGGAKIVADFHHAQLGSKVSLSVVGHVVDDKGVGHLIELAKIDDSFVHSSTDYHTQRTYDLNYATVNAELAKKAPNANLRIGPGTELFVSAAWMNVPANSMYEWAAANGTNNHKWGGVQRNGKIILPVPSDATAQSSGQNTGSSGTGFTHGGYVTGLDVANTITPNLVTQFPGLIAGQTIGSRYENELKLLVELNDLKRVGDILGDWAKDPKKVEAVFGPGWKMKENRKYVDSPMVDDYLDNANLDGARRGMALRFRTGSGITSLNYKPDDGIDMGQAVTARIEYQIGGVNKVDDFKVFMDSDHPLNPLQLIREKVPGAKPSDFTIKSVQVVGKRLKFELTAPSGDTVEFSLDHVSARKLDPQGKPTGPLAEFGQLEVEVDHLGARGSQNTVTLRRAYSDQDTLHGAALDKFLANLGRGSNMDDAIPPQFHGELDFAANSPMRTSNATNFTLAFGVFDKVRSELFGNNWIGAGQKAAVAAAGLGLVRPEHYAPSVKRMLDQKLGKTNATPTEHEQCLATLVKLSHPNSTSVATNP